MLAKVLLLLGASLVGQTDATRVPSHHHYFKRAACNHDNLYRCFIDKRYSIQASDFCAGLAPSTVTIATAATTTTVTETVESTVEGTTDAITSTTTIYTTTVPASTVIVTRGSQTKYKRDDAAAPPRCMTNGVTYPASRITSACSCIDVPAETVSATHVTGTVTVTETVTSYVSRVVSTTRYTTVSAAATSGARTITVNPPTSSNLLVNGDFGTSNYDFWELSPLKGWTVTMESMVAAPDTPPWACFIRSDSTADPADFKNTQPVDLVPGAQYKIGFTTPTNYEDWSSWGHIVLRNAEKGTDIVLRSFQYSTFTESPLYRIEVVFTATDNMAGYNEFSFRCLASSGRPFSVKFYSFFIEGA